MDLKNRKEVVDSHHRASPRSAVEILLQFAKGNSVATQWRFTATSTDGYPGRPPSCKQVCSIGVQIDRLGNGKIAGDWVSWDKHTQLEDLGLLS